MIYNQIQKNDKKMKHLELFESFIDSVNEAGMGLVLGSGNVFIGDIMTGGLKSQGQSIKIDRVDGDKVIITNLGNTSQRNIEGIKDLTLDPSGNTYKRTDGKGSFKLIRKK